MGSLFETDPKPSDLNQSKAESESIDLSDSPTGLFAVVAVERGIDSADGGLTYAIPEELSDLRIGERVRVPLGRGNRLENGYILKLTQQAPISPKTQKPIRAKPIDSRDAGHVSLTEDLIELAQWMARYYACPLGMVLATMLPAAVKKQTGAKDQQRVRRNPQKPDPQPKLTKLQQQVFDQATENWLPLRELADLAGAKSLSPVKQLIQKQLLETKLEEVVVSDLDLRAQSQDQAAPPELHADQARVLESIQTQIPQGFGVHLLHGVTGSGKTEVYLRLIQHLLQTTTTTTTPIRTTTTPAASSSNHSSQPGIIVLVPEISLTPQTVGRFLKRFEGVAVLHSGLTASQRHAQWRRIASGQAHIVVGARSALFAPLQNLRLIMVDEEHDSSYKQDQLPRYHARDCAIKRGQLTQATVVLGSATPSLESYYNCKHKNTSPPPPTTTPSKEHASSRFFYQPMPNRVAGLSLPRVDIVNLRESNKDRKGIHLLTPPLEDQLQRTIENKRQAILLLNRRGYANAIVCPDYRCGWSMTCDRCDATMVYHKHQQLPTGGVVRCHHCLSEMLLPQICPQCSRCRVTVFGLGTQRVEEELARKLPNLRMLRMDSDTMRTARDYQQTLEAFRQGEADVLLGTQMIAKGLDFANVSLVGVISADTSLNMPDFRAAERTFQLIAQVAGRAGRADDSGRVILQTLNPDDPTIQLAAEHDYTRFAEQELDYRKQAQLPPIGRMARIVIRDENHDNAQKRADHLYQQLQQHSQHIPPASNDAEGLRIRPPTPCPIARIADFHRYQIEILAPTAKQIIYLMTQLRNQGITSDQTTAIDIDPIHML